MTIQNTQCRSKILKDGKEVLIYSMSGQIVLQLCHQIASDKDILSSSFRVAVPLTPTETVALALDLLQVATPQLQDAGEPATSEQAKTVSFF